MTCHPERKGPQTFFSLGVVSRRICGCSCFNSRDPTKATKDKEIANVERKDSLPRPIRRNANQIKIAKILDKKCRRTRRNSDDAAAGQIDGIEIRPNQPPRAGSSEEIRQSVRWLARSGQGRACAMPQQRQPLNAKIFD